jgi:enoyl-[acyl-carrier protein] reductase/trans-2-enoyl-CoA reductase (NAD+)
MIIEPNERIYLFDSPPRWMRTKYKNQIEYVKSKAINGAKKVLVIGASTGFGLASKFQVLLDLMRLLLAYF